MPCFTRKVKVESITTGQTFGADVGLMDLVRQKVPLEGSNDDGDVTIVFCPIASRVGSDVQMAMQNVPRDKRIILVLMHHTRDVDYSTAGRPWSDEYPNIVLEAHVLFHESFPGLLVCSQNTNAVYEIQRYLQPKGIKRIRLIFVLLILLLALVFLVLLLYFEVQHSPINGTHKNQTLKDRYIVH